MLFRMFKRFWFKGGKVMAHYWYLRHLYNIASQASLSCFGQNSNVYNFSSNENMTLKLDIMTHFDTIFYGIKFFL